MNEAEIEKQFEAEEILDLETEENSSEDVLLFEKAFCNEKLSPDILPYEPVLVFRIKGYLASQKEVVERCSDTVETNFVGDLLMIEINRLLYLLTDYHRIRIFKIQKFVLYIIQDENMKVRLSETENIFAESYLALKHQHQTSEFLNQIPKAFQKFNHDESEPSIIETPNLAEFVYCRIDEDLDNFRLSQSNELETGDTAHKGDIIVVPYDKVSEHVINARATLL